jgi:hypothetical protein
MPARGPGPVAPAHRLLILSAIVCALVYAVFEARAFGRTGAASAALRAGLALVAAGALGVYLRSLRGLAARLTPRDSEPRER